MIYPIAQGNSRPKIFYNTLLNHSILIHCTCINKRLRKSNTEFQQNV